jgi:hypothetical protein
VDVGESEARKKFVHVARRASFADDARFEKQVGWEGDRGKWLWRGDRRELPERSTHSPRGAFHFTMYPCREERSIALGVKRTLKVFERFDEVGQRFARLAPRLDEIA